MPERRRLKTTRPIAQLRQGRADWYKITNQAGGDTAEVHIFDEIGWFGVTAADFIRDLSAITASTINVRLSSPGGDVFQGFALFEALRSHRAHVKVYVDSLAASIASVIAMAGDEIIMAPYAEMMIHDAMSVCAGNADDMRQMIEDLDRESDRIASVYAGRAGGAPEDWRSAMREETWYSAKEAVAAGLADEVASTQRSDEEVPDMAANWDLSVFTYPGRSAAPPPPTNTATDPTDPPVEPDPPAEPAPAEPVTPDPPADPEPAEPDPVADPVADPEPDPDPPDDWAAATAHLTTSPVDEWASITEALT